VPNQLSAIIGDILGLRRNLSRAFDKTWLVILSVQALCSVIEERDGRRVGMSVSANQDLNDNGSVK